MITEPAIKGSFYRWLFRLPLLLFVSACTLQAADVASLAPEQLRSLEGAAKGFPLTRGSRLQDAAGKIFDQAPVTNRVELAVKLVVVVAKQWPGEAADVVGKLTQLLPDQAVPLAEAALKALPTEQALTKQARAIASAAMASSPANCVNIASAARQIAPPSEHPSIWYAAMARVPKEQKTELDKQRAIFGVRETIPPPKRIENPARNK